MGKHPSERHSKPPKLADWFLRWYCSERFYEEIQGDLHERYYLMAEKHGIKTARRRYYAQVIRFFRPFRWKGLSEISHPLIHPAMLKNYFTTTYRNLLRHKGFSLLNILGLAIGMAACLILLRYANFERNYDRFQENSENTYRLFSNYYVNGEFRVASCFTGYALGPILEKEVPEITSMFRLHPSYSVQRLEYKNENGQLRQFFEKDLYWVDSTFLQIFGVEMVEGDPFTALDNPSNILLSESMVKKYFREGDDPMGKTITMMDSYGGDDFIITGVFKDVPVNTHLHYDFLTPLSKLLTNPQYTRDDGWGWQNFYTFFQTVDNVDTTLLKEKIETVFNSYRGEELAERNRSWKSGITGLENIYLHAGNSDDYFPHGNAQSIWFFALIGIIILVIAWVNYMNLSTARAIDRAREVGIRKTVGASRSELMKQFLFESLVVNGIAVILAFGLSMFLLPIMGDILGKDISVNEINHTQFWALLGGMFVVGALLSGIYPAFVLSSFKPVSVLKGAIDKLTAGISLRKVLVVVQFAASVALIAGTYSVYNQITFLKAQDIGMTLDQVITFRGPQGLDRDKNYEPILKSFKTRLVESPLVEAACGADEMPGGDYNWATQVWRDGDNRDNSQSGKFVWVDYNFIDTYQFELIAGRTFSEDFGTDNEGLVISERALEQFGLGTPEEALSQRLITGRDTVKILGVLKDFAWGSLNKEQNAFMFFLNPRALEHFAVRIDGANIPEALDHVRSTYEEIFPGNAFTYQFQDEYFDRQYKEDQQFGQVFGLFTTLAIIVACLGLFGLASLSATNRIKEMGIRKVLGASVGSLFYLMSKEFMILVAASILVGMPIAWWLTTEWLQTFPLRISLGISFFLIPAVMVLLVALLTVSYQTLRTAGKNPVEALRYE